MPLGHHGAEVFATARGAVLRDHYGLPAYPRGHDEHAIRLEGQEDSQEERAHRHLDDGPLDHLVGIVGPCVGTLGLPTGASLGLGFGDRRVDLRRLTRVYRWLDPSLDENAVFEVLREQWCDLIQHPEKWVETLPPAVWDPNVAVQRKEDPSSPVKKFELPLVGKHLAKLRNLEFPTLTQHLPGLGRNRELDVYGHLPTVLEAIEGLIEDTSRFTTYLAEVHALQHLGISFREWQQLQPPLGKPDDQSEVMCIHLAEPLALTAGSE